MKKVISELEKYGEEKFNEGLFVGLSLVEKIICWLDRQPDNEWQREVRSWAETALKDTRDKYSH